MDLRSEERLYARITSSVDAIPVPPGPDQLRRRRARGSRFPLVLAAAGIAAILAVTAGSLGALRGAREGPSPQVTASGQPSRPTVPPGYTTPPGPRRYPTRTAGEVLAGMATDPFITGNSPYWDPQSLGAPIFVRALRASDPDLWLVPHVTAGKVHGVYVVTLEKDGFGSAGQWAGGGGPGDPALAVPPISEARAWEIAAVPMPDRATAELVWMLVDPRSGFMVLEIWPMWMLTSRSGAVVFVTSDELLVSAARVGLCVSVGRADGFCPGQAPGQ